MLPLLLIIFDAASFAIDAVASALMRYFRCRCDYLPPPFFARCRRRFLILPPFLILRRAIFALILISGDICLLLLTFCSHYTALRLLQYFAHIIRV